MAIKNRKEIRRKVHRRIRKKISGTAEKPRLAVHLSNRHIYAQVIDDVDGRTLAAASTKDSSVGGDKNNIEVAGKIGELIAGRAKDAKVESVVFDRGGHLFHGRIRALADAAREGGLKF